LRRGSQILLVALADSAFAAPAHAHVELEALGGFWSGVVHWLTGVERPALVIALAIWAGAQKQRADAAVVAAVALGAFAAALATAHGGAESHSTFVPAVAALAVVGAAGAGGLSVGATTMRVVAACCGALAGAIGAIGATIGDRALDATGVSLAAAAATAYGLVAASFVAPWRFARIGLRLCAGAGAIAAAVCTLGHSSICGPG
jgi:hypothetical protein